MKKINENYAYGADSHNFLLYKSSVNQDKESKNYGKVTWSVIGYFGSFKGLFNRLADLCLKEEIGDFRVFNESLEAFKAWVKENVPELPLKDYVNN
jgi:hypothetical protein